MPSRWRLKASAPMLPEPLAVYVLAGVNGVGKSSLGGVAIQAIGA
jgi:signal recognition particle GTPase